MPPPGVLPDAPEGLPPAFCRLHTPAKERYLPFQWICSPEYFTSFRGVVMPALWVTASLVWLCCGIVGGIIGAGRNNGAGGFLLGVLFGPLGAIAAFALDGRPPCPKCGNKISNGIRICPTCHAELGWLDGQLGTLEQIEQRIARQVMNRAAEERFAKEQEEKAARQYAEFARQRKIFFAAVFQALASPLRLALRMLAAADRTLLSLAEGSQVAYRTMQIGWFVLLPLVVIAGIVFVIRADSSRSRPGGEGLEAAGRPAAVRLQPAGSPPNHP